MSDALTMTNDLHGQQCALQISMIPSAMNLRKVFGRLTHYTRQRISATVESMGKTSMSPTEALLGHCSSY